MLRLKEQSIEWVKFTGVMGIALNIIVVMLCLKGLLPVWVGLTTISVAILAVLTASLRPHWFRGFYRGGMTFSFHIGQSFGKVLLVAFFFLLVTPMGLLLRLMGKDLLHLKRDPQKTSFWHTAKNNREFDRMF
jgi:hypothetical protein